MPNGWIDLVPLEQTFCFTPPHCTMAKVGERRTTNVEDRVTVP